MTPPNAGLAAPAFPVEVAVQRICGHHRNLARVFAAQQGHAEALAAGACPPDFPLMAAILRYIELHLLGNHHRVEESCLLAAMRERGASGQLVDTALGAHSQSAQKFAALQSAFGAWRQQPDLRNPPFLELAADYRECELGHIAFEEDVLLPCAVETLPASDWAAIAEAFRDQDDPLFGASPDPQLIPLQHLLGAGTVTH
ncbi:MAG: hemerythrin domain-containing protein [Betaproteobacteria bacterium]|nr:hemerythrin domain-containing protein [Betaproteobacteria bacterium]